MHTKNFIENNKKSHELCPLFRNPVNQSRDTRPKNKGVSRVTSTDLRSSEPKSWHPQKRKQKEQGAPGAGHTPGVLHALLNSGSKSQRSEFDLSYKPVFLASDIKLHSEHGKVIVRYGKTQACPPAAPGRTSFGKRLLKAIQIL